MHGLHTKHERTAYSNAFALLVRLDVFSECVTVLVDGLCVVGE